MFVILWVMVFNATFYSISVISWQSFYWWRKKKEPSWSWLYGIWIYNYLCLSPLKLWVWIPHMARCTQYNIMWSSLPVTYGGLGVFSTLGAVDRRFGFYTWHVIIDGNCLWRYDLCTETYSITAIFLLCIWYKTIFFQTSNHAAIRRKSKDWLARNQENVSEWDDMSIRGLFHCKN
jgi:hypothetical protein